MATENEAGRCASCGKRIGAEQNWVTFPCPQCAETDIVRCEKCKTLSNSYTCVKCGFEGP